jgi:hypothetical protein
MKKEILITLMTDRETKAEEFCKPFLELLYINYPALFPEFVSFEEPINVPVENMEAALSFFKVDDTLWKKRGQGVCGQMFHKRSNSAATINISIRYTKKFFLGNLFEDVIKICEPKYAYVHLCTEEELRSPLEDLRITADLFKCAADIPIRNKGFNNLAWMNYFSEPYLARMDISGLRELEFNVKPFHKGVILKVSDSIEDIIRNLDEFIRRRKIAKSCFDDKFFRSPTPIY